MYHFVQGLYRWATRKEEYYTLVLGAQGAGKSHLIQQIEHMHDPATRGLAKDGIYTFPTVGMNVSQVPFPKPAPMNLRFWDVAAAPKIRALWKDYTKDCHAIVFVIDSAAVAAGAAHDDDDDDNDDGDGGGHLSLAAADPDGSRPVAESDPAAGTSLSPPVESGTYTIFEPAPDPDRADFPSALAESVHLLKYILSCESAARMPILILANKQDDENSISVALLKKTLDEAVFADTGRLTSTSHGPSAVPEPASAPADTSPGVAAGAGRPQGSLKIGGARDIRVMPCSAVTGEGVMEAVEWIRTRVLMCKDIRPPKLR